MLNRSTGYQSPLSPQIVRCNHKSYDGKSRADEGLNDMNLDSFRERRLVS